MSELNQLYQRVILDHNKNPRNFYKPDGSNRKAEGYNPVCGDQITIHARLDGGMVREIGFQGSGCAISRASASLMTEAVKGKNRSETQTIFESLQRMLSGAGFESDEPGGLNALSGVRRFPVRIKCALLPWQTLIAALNEEAESVSTE